jgi:hypothetical protein
MTHRSTGDVERAREVRPEDAVPLVVVEVLQSGRVGDTGVVDDCVEAAECIRGLVDHRVDGSRIRDVRLHGDGVGALFAGGFGNRFGCIGRLVVGDCHVVFCCECECDCATNSPARAGYEDVHRTIHSYHRLMDSGTPLALSRQ